MWVCQNLDTLTLLHMFPFLPQSSVLFPSRQAVRLCLYNVQRVQIHHPPEGRHHGAACIVMGHLARKSRAASSAPYGRYFASSKTPHRESAPQNIVADCSIDAIVNRTASLMSPEAGCIHHSRHSLETFECEAEKCCARGLQSCH